jgi:hypothetical protein
MDRKSATSQCRAWSDDIVMNGKDKREVSDEHTDTDVPFPFRSMVGKASIECLKPLSRSLSVSLWTGAKRYFENIHSETVNILEILLCRVASIFFARNIKY